MIRLALNMRYIQVRPAPAARSRQRIVWHGCQSSLAMTGALPRRRAAASGVTGVDDRCLEVVGVTPAQCAAAAGHTRQRTGESDGYQRRKQGSEQTF